MLGEIDPHAKDKELVRLIEKGKYGEAYDRARDGEPYDPDAVEHVIRQRERNSPNSDTALVNDWVQAVVNPPHRH